MNKTVKNLIKIAAGSAAAYLAVGELAYESILNIDFSKKMTSRFHLENKSMMDVLLNADVYASSYVWFDALQLRDNILVDAKGENVHAYILKQPAYSEKWAIVAHGYCGDPRAEAPFAKHFYEKGYNILFPHMRAHENDEHRYCSMGYFDKDILCAWINYIVTNDQDSQIIMHGVSMGASTVMMVTGEQLPKNVKCAVADCGFSTLRGMIEFEMKTLMHLPTFPLLNAMNTVSKLRGKLDINKCSAVDAVKKSNTPTLFIHGTADDMVPYSMLDEVFNACTAEKDRLDVPGAVHTAAVAVDRDAYFAKLDEFTEKYVD